MGGTFSGKKLSPPKGLGKVPGKLSQKTYKNLTIYGKFRKNSPPAALKTPKKSPPRTFLYWVGTFPIFGKSRESFQTFPKVPPI